MDTFYAWWNIIIQVLTPTLGIALQKIGSKVSTISEKLGKGLSVTGNVFTMIPILLFLGRTVYDDFFTDTRYMGTLM